MKLEFYRRIFEKYSNVEFNNNPSFRSPVVSCGRTDAETGLKKLIVHFHNFSSALKFSVLNLVTDQINKSFLTLTVYHIGACDRNGYPELKNIYSQLQILKRLDVLCVKVQVTKWRLVCVVPLVMTVQCLYT